MARRAFIEIGFYGLAIFISILFGFLFRLLIGNAAIDIPYHDTYLVLNAPFVLSLLLIPLLAWLIFGIRILLQKFKSTSTVVVFSVNALFAIPTAFLFFLCLSVLLHGSGQLPRRYYSFSESGFSSHQFIYNGPDMTIPGLILALLILSSVIVALILWRAKRRTEL